MIGIFLAVGGAALAGFGLMVLSDLIGERYNRTGFLPLLGIAHATNFAAYVIMTAAALGAVLVLIGVN